MAKRDSVHLIELGFFLSKKTILVYFGIQCNRKGFYNRKKEVGQNQKDRSKMLYCSFEDDKTTAIKCRRLLEAEKEKETDSPLKPPEERQPC